jgi:hypothetical protein
LTNNLRDRITTADLDWWLDLAPTLTWRFATTYAETAPHSYIVLGKMPGLTRDDFRRAAAVIRTFGQPAMFYSMTNTYLTSRDGSLKWWAMDISVFGTGLINQATTEAVYGDQDAPSTASDSWSDYDEIATDYDRLWWPVDGDEKVGLLRLVDGIFDEAPTTLDIGCGTGALLDLGVTTPERYTGVDPSHAMLNELLMKHNRSRFADVIALRMQDALSRLDGRSFDLVTATFGAASHLDEATMRMLPSLCSGTLVLMAYADDYLPGFYRHDLPEAPAALAALRSVAADHRAAVERIGKFETVHITYSAGSGV